VQRRVGKPATFALILTGAALSAFFSPTLAIASGVAFLVSESIDFAVFSALERHGVIVAVAMSNVVSLLVDSVVFLWLAFGGLAFIEGQIIGKAWATLAAIVVLVALRSRRRTPAPVPA
jgi:queuosine precursor transporter